MRTANTRNSYSVGFAWRSSLMIDAQGLPLTRISGGMVNSAKSGSPKPTRAPISISLEIASSISFSDGAATPGGEEKRPEVMCHMNTKSRLASATRLEIQFIAVGSALTPNAQVNRRRSAKRGGHQHWPIKWRSHGQCWRPR